MYKYVNKKNISTTIGGISFTPYSGHTSSTPVAALDIASNGWDFDRYYNEVLANTSNDDTPIGEIRYFPSNPGNGWLKCDGAPYLRTDYPEYEGMRPDSAWKFEDVTGTVQDFHWAWRLPNTNILYTQPELDTLFRSTDGLLTGSSVLVGCGLYPAIAVLPSGRVVAIDFSTRNVHYSDDNGVTWTTLTAAFPTAPVNYNQGGQIVAIDQCILTTGELQIPIKGTNKILTTTDGATWTEVVASISAFPTLTDGYPEPGYEDSYLLYTGPSAGNIDLSATVVNIADRPSTMYLARPRGVLSFCKTASAIYEICAQYPGWLDVGGGAVAHPIPQEDHSFWPTSLIKVGNRVIAVAPSAYRGSSKVSWLSPDGKSLETGDLLGSVIGGFFWFSENGRLGQINFADYSLFSMFNIELPEAVVLKFSTDPLKFNAPGLAPKANIHPYVYTGA